AARRAACAAARLVLGPPFARVRPRTRPWGAPLGEDSVAAAQRRPGPAVKDPPALPSGEGGGSRGGQILVDEGGRTAQRFVEVPEQSLAHPFALDPGVEGGLVAQADLYQALAGRVARHDQPDGGARIDDHPPAAGGNGEG